MQPFNVPITNLIPQRYSCRVYDKTSIPQEITERLRAFLGMINKGPLGTPLRFEQVAATEQDRKSLSGLGTYGQIKDAAGFIIGAVGSGAKNMEDFGWGMEAAVLYATELGLSTCWLGGIFTRSSFSRQIRIMDGESVPCVTAFGYATEKSRELGRYKKAKPDARLPWEALFFQSSFDDTLTREDAGIYAAPLEMLRLAPSSRNTQPWRVVQRDVYFHFYLARSGGYGPGSLPFRLLGLADLQRVDVGIAMCHFELAARERGLAGKWVVCEPDLQKPDEVDEYVITWVS